MIIILTQAMKEKNGSYSNKMMLYSESTPLGNIYFSFSVYDENIFSLIR